MIVNGVSSLRSFEISNDKKLAFCDGQLVGRNIISKIPKSIAIKAVAVPLN
jgi:hypothetical protein